MSSFEFFLRVRDSKCFQPRQQITKTAPKFTAESCDQALAGNFSFPHRMCTTFSELVPVKPTITATPNVYDPSSLANIL